MKTFAVSMALCGALFTASPAHAAPPTEESVKELLRVTQAESMMENMYGQVENAMRQGMRQASAGQTLSAEQEKMLDIAPRKFVAVMRQELNWAVMSPGFVQIYRDTLDQSEVDGLVAFYKSPAGQAFIQKMPQILQRSMALSQSQMASFLPKMRTAMEEAMKEAGIKP